MANNFESKLVEASSAETLKAAKQLLKNSNLTCAWRDEKGEVNAAFQERNNSALTRVSPGLTGAAECSCSNRVSGKLCEHAIAAIMYSGRFKQEFDPIDDGVSNYAGLKFESLDKLAEKENHKATARVCIQAESAFPHVPSKWENAVLAVKLSNREREYLGNVNNLRQLFFEKTLSISMKLSDFSLQDQQIIRFLAINGEPDNSSVLLNSEQTAEFFHCLIGFDRFLRDGRRLFVHGERTEPVILRKKENGRSFISPGIRVEGTLLPIKHAKVISGRAGCWIGRQGEYFFLPATLDVGWLRNFFRTGEQELNGKISENFLLDGQFPLPVIDTDSLEMKSVGSRILLGGKFDADNVFRMQVNFLYDGSIAEINSGRLVRNKREFCQRDECAELQLASELAMFGFQQADGEFVLPRTEAVGIFFDKVLPLWIKQRGNICLESSLAALCGSACGVPEISFRCRVERTAADAFVMSYVFATQDAPLSFKNIGVAVRAGQNYMKTSQGSIVRISDALHGFMRGSENVLRAINEKDCTFELPFFGTEYFLHLTAGLPEARPAELFIANPGNFAPKALASHRLNAELRTYQREGVDWMRKMTDANFNVILADEMGLGKTVQVLALLAERKRKDMPPALVICPASLVINWERETQKFLPDFRVAALIGGNRENVWDNTDMYDLIVISYASARRDADFLKKNKFSYMILDEAQHIKNPGTANSQNCKLVAADHRIVLTGTPLENSSEDLWSIFDFLQPGMLGSFNSFKHYYANIGEDKFLQTDLAARVAPFLKRRTKMEVGQELPPKSEHTLFCKMSPPQRKLYEEIRKNGCAQLARIAKGDSKANTEIFTTLLRLRQVCCHPELLPEAQGDAVPSAKFELLQELVLEHIDSGHKMLLFSQFTSLLAKITAWLDAENIRYEYLDGATRNRQQHVDNFNDSPEIPLFLLSLKAGGTGLNLTSADTVVICDPWWNPAVELQATDRTHRIGQTRPVSSIKLLVSDSIEEKILALQSHKQEIFDNVIDNPAAAASRLSIEELQFLLG